MPAIEMSALWCFLGASTATVVEMMRRSFARGSDLEREYSEEHRKDIKEQEEKLEEERKARVADAERRALLRSMQQKANEDLQQLQSERSKNSTLESNGNEIPDSAPLPLPRHSAGEVFIHGHTISHCVPGLPLPKSPARRRPQSVIVHRTLPGLASGGRFSQVVQRESSAPNSHSTSPEFPRNRDEISNKDDATAPHPSPPAQPADLKKQFDSAAIMSTFESATKRLDVSGIAAPSAASSRTNSSSKGSTENLAKMFAIGDSVIADDGFRGAIVEEFSHRGEVLYLLDGGARRKLYPGKELRKDGN